MEIKRVGSQASIKGPSDWFTGTVRIDPLFTAPDPALVSGRACCRALRAADLALRRGRRRDEGRLQERVPDRHGTRLPASG